MTKLHQDCSNCKHEGTPVFDESIYWQNNPRYADYTIGESNTSMQTYGCLLMSLSYVTRRDPLEVNQLFIDEGVYSNDLIDMTKACDVLGLDNYYRDYDINNMPEQKETIKEVYLGKSAHFVVRFNENGERSIFDPWIGEKKVINYYTYISYRVFDK